MEKILIIALAISTGVSLVNLSEYNELERKYKTQKESLNKCNVISDKIEQFDSGIII